MIRRLFSTLTAEHWERRPSRGAIAAFCAVLAGICWGMAAGWVPLLDSATLLIHEAGHPLLGMLSERLMVYGGTVFQLAFPCIFAWHFARDDQALGYCFGLAWLGASLRNVGVYMADARLQGLPLVGAGDRLHDWTEIFGRWGLLGLDVLIGGLVGALGWALIILCAWLLWRLWAAAGPQNKGQRPGRTR